MQEQVEQFAEAHRPLTAKMVDDAARFNREIVGYPIPAQPELMSDDRANFRVDFMQEELDEFLKAQREGDLDGAVDAIIDMMYVGAGALNEMGVATQPTWDEVHRANMAKKRGSITKRPGGQGFDAIKPEGWTAPSHADYLTITSEDIQTILAIRRGEVEVINKPVGKPNTNNPKIIVMGYARHGKDTVCELMAKKYGLKFTSSSWFCAKRVIFPALKDKYGYKDVKECYNDRVNHRAEWFDLITSYNTPDRTRLGREIFEENDVYCGIRNSHEFYALKKANVFNLAIWVDARGRGMPIEQETSCSIMPHMADLFLDNNKSIEDLERNLEVLMQDTYGDLLMETLNYVY